jgi:hypothetical protein
MSMERKKVIKKQRRSTERNWRKSDSCSQRRSFNSVAYTSLSNSQSVMMSMITSILPFIPFTVTLDQFCPVHTQVYSLVIITATVHHQTIIIKIQDQKVIPSTHFI